MALVLTSIFTCSPIEGSWDTVSPGDVHADMPLWYINAADNIASDLFIFALPSPYCGGCNCHAPSGSLIAILCLGFF